MLGKVETALISESHTIFYAYSLSRSTVFCSENILYTDIYRYITVKEDIPVALQRLFLNLSHLYGDVVNSFETIKS